MVLQFLTLKTLFAVRNKAPLRQSIFLLKWLEETLSEWNKRNDFNSRVCSLPVCIYTAFYRLTKI